ncbi:MAG TPA: type II secretion system protein [Candidatus Methylacidiphilales bacterium]|jgi:type II secretion system protein H|nr:type II secretion system protein [Candidatus Methylacidiphilales bacterium]
MNRAHPRHGAPAKSGIPGKSDLFGRSFTHLRRTGFTLLEMCMVLLIMAILAGLSMPAMESAFTEQAVRKDAGQLALMVKTAMIQSAEQHRTYVIDLTSTSMALHPQGEAAADPDAAASTSDDDASADDSSAPKDVEITSDLDPPNQLLAPDAIKVDVWDAMPADTQWVFDPGELCPASRVRVKRGDAWVEMSFNALTGDVENENYYVP